MRMVARGTGTFAGGVAGLRGEFALLPGRLVALRVGSSLLTAGFAGVRVGLSLLMVALAGKGTPREMKVLDLACVIAF